MNTSDASNLKKLMKIIYQKEKQVQKYRKQLREKNRLRQYRDSQNEESKGFSQEEKQMLTYQVNQNMEILKNASKKIAEMEKTIGNLKADLEEEQQHTAEINDQLQQAKLQLSRKDQFIAELKTDISLFQNASILSKEQTTKLRDQIQMLKFQNSKLKLLLEDTSQQKLSMASKLHKAQSQISKYLQKLNRRSNKFGPRSTTALALSRSQIRKDKKIKTQTNLDCLQDNFQQKINQLIQFFKNWQKILILREQEMRQKFQASLSQQGSIQGISRLIKQSFVVLHQPDDPELNDTQFKMNEQKLLQQLQRQCQQSLPNSVDKQKLVELSEIKQSLKMTKEVNAQLFDQLGRQQKIISMFKQTFKSWQKKKIFKCEDDEDIVKIRRVFG